MYISIFLIVVIKMLRRLKELKIKLLKFEAKKGRSNAARRKMNALIRRLRGGVNGNGDELADERAVIPESKDRSEYRPPTDSGPGIPSRMTDYIRSRNVDAESGDGRLSNQDDTYTDGVIDLTEEPAEEREIIDLIGEKEETSAPPTRFDMDAIMLAKGYKRIVPPASSSAPPVSGVSSSARAPRAPKGKKKKEEKKRCGFSSTREKEETRSIKCTCI